MTLGSPPLDCGLGSPPLGSPPLDRIFHALDSVIYLGVPYSSVKRLSPLLIISHLEVKIRKTFGSLVHLRGNIRRDILARLYQSMVLPLISFPAVILKTFPSSTSSQIKVVYFRYLKFLLGFPLSARNTSLKYMYGIKDPLDVIKIKCELLVQKARNYLEYRNLFPFFEKI